MLYQEHVHPFAEDARLLLFSDGLPEFTNGRDGRMGEAGLATEMEGTPPALSPGALIDSICRAAGIEESVAMPDDVTIICIDRRAHCSSNCIIKTGPASDRAIGCPWPDREEVRCQSS
ncbi:SpoIIE family protein phosphatase [Bradyrhizobium betae]|uniref:SpoIIE family protein phosphatase n=1 Tax=Bradyrhizobium betae TaxID=244734 RepID=UPI003D67B66C